MHSQKHSTGAVMKLSDSWEEMSVIYSPNCFTKIDQHTFQFLTRRDSKSKTSEINSQQFSILSSHIYSTVDHFTLSYFKNNPVLALLILL